MLEMFQDRIYPVAAAAVLASTLAGCAATRIDVSKPTDGMLDCRGIEKEMAEAKNAESEAKSAKVKSVLAFGLVGYLSSKDGADEAEKAARERQERLGRLARERGCAAGEG